MPSHRVRPETRPRPPDAAPLSERELATRVVAEATDRELLEALVRGWCLGAVVPLALDRVEREPLRSAGRFPGALLRGLMEVPNAHWARQPRQHARFCEALRRAAELRRALPPDERMRFWTPLDGVAPVTRAPSPAPREEVGSPLRGRAAGRAAVLPARRWATILALLAVAALALLAAA